MYCIFAQESKDKNNQLRTDTECLENVFVPLVSTLQSTNLTICTATL